MKKPVPKGGYYYYNYLWKKEWESRSNDQLLVPMEPEMQGADPCGQVLWAAYTQVWGTEAAVPKVWDGEHHGGCRADSTTQHPTAEEGSNSLYFLFESCCWHLRRQGQFQAARSVTSLHVLTSLHPKEKDNLKARRVVDKATPLEFIHRVLISRCSLFLYLLRTGSRRGFTTFHLKIVFL